MELPNSPRRARLAQITDETRINELFDLYNSTYGYNQHKLITAVLGNVGEAQLRIYELEGIAKTSISFPNLWECINTHPEILIDVGDIQKITPIEKVWILSTRPDNMDIDLSSGKSIEDYYPRKKHGVDIISIEPDKERSMQAINIGFYRPNNATREAPYRAELTPIYASMPEVTRIPRNIPKSPNSI